jgi:hypothetical protein
MIAALLLIVVFFGLAQIYTRSRTQLDYEEDRRKATAVAQMRLDGIRRDYRYEDLASLDATDTTFVSDGWHYTVSHAVTAGSPEPHATAIDITVSWVAKVGEADVHRTLETSTILARGMP